ncbi:hypothetical protein RRG08_018339 [Elysia crispata]|uniref:Uncharacterized protein n=1 Tax=Elysia crispata TaxID=231223 RepID=A0AAE0Y0B7_9GAST|nr:hypothetical protein RRG08_018339 [Elysia crispata]
MTASTASREQHGRQAAGGADGAELHQDHDGDGEIRRGQSGTGLNRSQTIESKYRLGSSQFNLSNDKVDDYFIIDHAERIVIGVSEAARSRTLLFKVLFLSGQGIILSSGQNPAGFETTAEFSKRNLSCIDL